jgi:hypothetical protein
MAVEGDAKSWDVARLFEDKQADAHRILHRMAEARRQATTPRAEQTAVRRRGRRFMNLSIFSQVWLRWWRLREFCGNSSGIF